MGILDLLMSSDPLIQSKRRGILESVGKYAGAQPVEPTMGQVMSSIPTGIQRGEDKFYQNEMIRIKLEQIKAPNQQVVGDKDSGYKLITIPKPELKDDGTYETAGIDIQEITKGITPTTLMVGVDDIEIKERIPNIDLTKENEGTTITFDGEKYKIDRKKKDKKDLYWEKIDRYNELNAKADKTAEDIKNKESINDILLPIAKKILAKGYDSLTDTEKAGWNELRRVPWLESLMKGNDIITSAINSTTSNDNVIVIPE